MKKFLHISLIVSIFAIIPFGFVYAQPEIIKDSHREVIDSVDKIYEVRESNLTQQEKLAKEMELKKTALDKVVEFSILETENFKTNLINLEVGEDEFEAELLALRDTLLIKLDDYLEHFDFVRNGIKASDNLEIVQSIAGSFNDWREFTYNPEIKKVIEFILIFQNKSFIKLADLRFGKIASDLRTVISPKLQSSIRQQFLNPAAISIRGAREFNNRAMALLADYISEEKAFGESEIDTPGLEEEAAFDSGFVPEEEIAVKEDEKQVEELTIRDLVISSLQKLKDAYSKFLSLRDFVGGQSGEQ